MLDTWAWIEHFRGAGKAGDVKQFISSGRCFTSAISIAELSAWCEKNRIGRQRAINYVKSMSLMIELDYEILERVGVIKIEKRKNAHDFGLIDAIILATARQYNFTIVTGDRHFKGENAVML